MIREATIKDIPALVGMGRDFFALTKLPVTYNEESVSNMISSLISSEDAVVFVDENVESAIGGMVYPFYFNSDVLSGNEVFWWSQKKGSGIRLLRILEAWAKDKGATLFQMTCLDDGHERIGKFYEKRGYQSTEHNYMKVI